MAEALEAVCFENGGGDGMPMTKLHGLRMLDPSIFSHIPALVMADRIEAHASAHRVGPHQWRAAELEVARMTPGEVGWRFIDNNQE